MRIPATALHLSAALVFVLTALTSCDTRVSLLSGGPAPFAVRFVVESIDPPPGNLEVGPATEFRIVLSVSVDRDASPTAPLSALRLSDGGIIVGGRIRFEDGIPRAGEAPADARDRVIVWSADTPLVPGPNYRITIDPELVSVDGQRLGIALQTQDGSPLPAEFASFANPPSTVSGLAIRAVTSASIELSWSAADDDVTASSDLSYEVFAVPIAEAINVKQPSLTTGPGVLEGLLDRLEPGTEYLVAARAIDAAGNPGSLSKGIRATTEAIIDVEPPTFAGIVDLEVISPTEIRVTWNDAEDDVDPPELLRYRVYLAVDSGAHDFAGGCLASAGSLCRVSAPGVRELIVGEIDPDSTFFAVVRAIDTSGNESTNLEELAATTLISFQDQILPVLTHPVRGCTLSSNCHRGNTPREGLNLEGYDGLLAGGDSQRTGVRPPVIVPGEEISDDMQSFFLWRTDQTNQNFEGPRMPLARSPWSAAQLGTLKRWIRQGALDN